MYNTDVQYVSGHSQDDHHIFNLEQYGGPVTAPRIVLATPFDSGVAIFGRDAGGAHGVPGGIPSPRTPLEP